MAEISLLQAVFAAPLVGFSLRWPRVLHAVERDQIAKAWKRSTAVAVCGATRLRLIAEDNYALEWPPQKRMPFHERCESCWQATGRRRPRVKVLGSLAPRSVSSEVADG